MWKQFIFWLFFLLMFNPADSMADEIKDVGLNIVQETVKTVCVNGKMFGGDNDIRCKVPQEKCELFVSTFTQVCVGNVWLDANKPKHLFGSKLELFKNKVSECVVIKYIQPAVWFTCPELVPDPQ